MNMFKFTLRETLGIYVARIRTPTRRAMFSDPNRNVVMRLALDFINKELQ